MPRSRVRHSGAAAAWQISPSKGTAARLAWQHGICENVPWPRPLLSSDNDSRDRLHLVCPRAIGPYSQAVIVQGARSIYCSGQIPLDPETGELVGNGDVEKETHRVMQNLAGVLKAAGVSLDAVVKTTIYLTDLASFAAVNAVYATYFASTPPARATVQVAALPRGAQVEIDAVAVAA